MARDIVTREDEPLFRPRGSVASDAVGERDDAPRVLDLEPEEESPFLRGQKRVPVRRGPLPKKAANRLKQALLALAVLGVCGATAAVFYRYGTRSWRFRLESAANVELAGTHNVPRRQVFEVLGADIGHNIFLVPLDERRRQLEAVPWVESATLMRLLPDRLRVDIKERTPVAFVRVGRRIALIDAGGVVMDLPAGHPQRYSFPVITGMSEAEPLSTRAARMRIFSAVLRELDSEGARYSQDVSEMDLSDPEDVKIMVADPAGAVLLHLGSSDFLRRYKIYIAHVQEWRQQFQKLESVNLRYDRQVIVNLDSGPHPSAARPAAPAQPAGKTAAQARKAASSPARKPSPRQTGAAPPAH